MKKTILLMLSMIITAGCASAGSLEMFDAMKSCSTYNDGVVAIREVTAGQCNIFSKSNGRTTLCTMPTSMARKLAIFKTASSLNEAQLEDMQKIEMKYCKTK